MNHLRAQIRSMLRVEPREGGFRALFDVRSDLSILPDHFRDGPILPALCMVQAVLIAGAQALGAPELHLSVLKNAKMRQPILPGDEIVIDAAMIDGPGDGVAIKATFTGGGQRRAEISLVARRQTQEESTPV